MLRRASLIEPDHWFLIAGGMGWGFFVLFCFVLFSELTVSGTRGGQVWAPQPPSSAPANKNTVHKNKHRARLSKPQSPSIIFLCIWCFSFFFFLITSVVPSLSQDCKAKWTASMWPPSTGGIFYWETLERFSRFLSFRELRKCAIFPVIKVSAFVFRLTGFIQTFVRVCIAPPSPRPFCAFVK